MSRPTEMTPLNQEAKGLVPDTKVAEIPAMYKALRSSFASGKTKSYEWRIGQLRALGRMINENLGMIEKSLYDDLKTSPFEIKIAQVGLILNDLALYEKHLKGWMAPECVTTNVLNLPGSAYIINEPLGCVVIYGAWNYNFLLSLQPVIGAIAAGNCVLLKPGDYAVKSTQAMMQLIPRYMDQECIKVVNGGPELSDAILQHQWQKIFFTGSANVGRIIYRKAAEHLTPCTLELGGKSPCIVDSSADLAVSARRIVWGACTNAGQTCVRPDYILVEKSFGDRLVKALESEVTKFYGDDPKASPWYSRLINDRAFQRVCSLLEDCGDLIALGGSKNADRADRYIPPTIINFGSNKNRFAKSKVMEGEIFGPLIPVCYYDSNEEVQEFITSRPVPLSAYLFSSNTAMITFFKNNIHSGSQCINDTIVQLSCEELPFGGCGGSGFGAYHGKHSFDCFSHKKSVLQRGTAMDVPMRYPPYTPHAISMVGNLLNPKVDDYYEHRDDDNYRRSMILCFGMATQKYRRCKEEYQAASTSISQARANTLDNCLMKHFNQAITLLLKTTEVNGKCTPVKKAG
ncbi:hypothetical protein FOL47_006436 [Perkinsus chesapeaki]|uniref:Aldehyde dehydrogenase domain-containing protein n=1 Tax=Perkinsus chesapeaki TaxID=330153 RepID=A0A7J6MYL2_PERCH|nr:hypothetical protein FOL47_006436 [Perkinsus chesapeaki]